MTFQEYIQEEMEYYKEYESDCEYDDYTNSSDNVEYTIAE